MNPRLLSRLALMPALAVLVWSCSSEADTVSEGGTEADVPEASYEEDFSREGEIVGQVVDVSCYVAQGLSGDTHRQCAEICANDLGIPLNILDEDGTLWQLVDDDMPGVDQNPTVVQYAEQRIRASGTLISKSGNKAIIIKDVALVEGSANPAALEGSRDAELGRTFNNESAANPCGA